MAPIHHPLTCDYMWCNVLIRVGELLWSACDPGWPLYGGVRGRADLRARAARGRGLLGGGRPPLVSICNLYCAVSFWVRFCEISPKVTQLQMLHVKWMLQLYRIMIITVFLQRHNTHRSHAAREEYRCQSGGHPQRFCHGSCGRLRAAGKGGGMGWCVRVKCVDV